MFNKITFEIYHVFDPKLKGEPGSELKTERWRLIQIQGGNRITLKIYLTCIIIFCQTLKSIINVRRV